MTSPQKSKGNTAERAICEKLEQILGGKFIRVPNSGAFVGGVNYMRTQQMDAGQIKTFKGDIITPSNLPKLVIESKFYKDFNGLSLLTGKSNAQLDGWLEQNLMICDPNDFPVLIMKFNRKGSFVVVREQDVKDWTLYNYAVYHYTDKNNGCVIKFIITEFEKFFEDNKERIIKRSS